MPDTKKNRSRFPRSPWVTRSSTRSRLARSRLSLLANSGSRTILSRSAIVRDERLEISVPETRKVILKSVAGAPYETQHAGGRTIYLWKHANLSLAADDAAKNQPETPSAKPADVELTTFAGWEAVARWYAKHRPGPQRANSGNPRENRRTDSRRNRNLSPKFRRSMTTFRQTFETWNCSSAKAAGDRTPQRKSLQTSTATRRTSTFCSRRCSKPPGFHRTRYSFRTRASSMRPCHRPRNSIT